MEGSISGHYFVSYAGCDDAEFARSVADALESGVAPRRYRVWLAARGAAPRPPVYDTQVEAIKTCIGVLVVLSKNDVSPPSKCVHAWDLALRYRKPIVLLRIHPGTVTPSELGSRVVIDFSHDFTMGVTALRDALSRIGTAEGLLQELRDRLADAEQLLGRAEDNAPRVGNELEQLRQDIHAQQRIVDEPGAARERTEARIASGLEREKRRGPPAPTSPNSLFVSPRHPVVPDCFHGRQSETRLLADFLRAEQSRVFWVLGPDGVGKTALVSHVLSHVDKGSMAECIGEPPVDGIVCLGRVVAHAVSFPNLLLGLCKLLPPDTARELLDRYRDPRQTPGSLMRTLLAALRDGRAVVLLDGLDGLIDAEGVGLTDAALEEALRAVVTSPAHGVKFIVSARSAPEGLSLTRPDVHDSLQLAGLPSPDAQGLLRAADPDGQLGLRHATGTALNEAVWRTRGVPRALEALAGILAADCYTTLSELMSDAVQSQGDFNNWLISEAFDRLDARTQAVVQALAVYALPVPAVAVDYLLTPRQPAIDSEPILSRLVSSQLVKRDGERYYMHDLDRQYALHRLTTGASSAGAPDRPPVTHRLLCARAAEYFEHTRTARRTWRNLSDLAPHLAEFDLRCHAGDYDAAARVLFDIDEHYLHVWGHFRIALGMLEQIKGRLSEPAMNYVVMTRLGNVYVMLGEYRRATECYELVLRGDAETKDPSCDSVALIGLGACHGELAEFHQATDCYLRALDINRRIGNRRGESVAVSGLGNSYARLGDIRLALDYHRQALSVDRGIGHRSGEGADLVNLGTCWSALGNSEPAVHYLGLGLAEFREIGDRSGEALALLCLAEAQADGGLWSRAIECCQDGLRLSDELGLVQGSSEGRVCLATVYLHTGEIGEARAVARASIEYNYLPQIGNARLVLAASLIPGSPPAATRQAFGAALRAADQLLSRTADSFTALDLRALSLCGLALYDPDRIGEASKEFGRARAITRADGIVARVLRLFDVIALHDRRGSLRRLRGVAAGESDPP